MRCEEEVTWIQGGEPSRRLRVCIALFTFSGLLVAGEADPRVSRSRATACGVQGGFELFGSLELGTLEKPRLSALVIPFLFRLFCFRDLGCLTV